MSDDGKSRLSGSGLQQSQSGGGSGEFGGNQDQAQRSGQQGGGARPADMSNAGGSSGTGGYGSSQDVVNHQDQAPKGGAQGGLAGSDRERASGQSISRGERYDEEANGGRGVEDVSPSSDALEFAGDQRAHQDRGQSEAADDFNREAD